ncbi:MAG: class I SAM-dependent methyltransferase [Acidimicrobiia bacterium]|jgi:ubiquinone/menaquinone biosynthesis C-methylase UbiE|nr:class I SAM-dependent methyltransferase [Acidimicrobiia bacterium]
MKDQVAREAPATSHSRESAANEAIPIGNHYDKYGSTNSIEQRMMANFMKSLGELLEGLAPRRILEIGVGEGEIVERLAQRFPGADIIGVDLPDERLAGEWRQRHLPAVFADATKLPFDDGTFDLALAIEVLEHIPVPQQALDELARVCHGTVILSVPFEPIWRIGNMARGRYLKELGNTPGHVNHWTRRGFRKFVDAELTVESQRSPLPWTMLRATTRTGSADVVADGNELRDEPIPGSRCDGSR